MQFSLSELKLPSKPLAPLDVFALYRIKIQTMQLSTWTKQAIQQNTSGMRRKILKLRRQNMNLIGFYRGTYLVDWLIK